MRDEYLYKEIQSPAQTNLEGVKPQQLLKPISATVVALLADRGLALLGHQFFNNNIYIGLEILSNFGIVVGTLSTFSTLKQILINTYNDHFWRN